MNAWVYCISGTPANLGSEQRARAWVASSTTLVLYTPGFPSPTAQGDEFEVHARHPRSRKLEAINEAVGKLGLYWYREFIDESITTQQRTWRYVLPAGQNWAGVYKVEVQLSLDPTLVGYPYADARAWNWRVYRDVDTAGNETWYLQFGTLPPSGRKLRIFGVGYYSDLVADTDKLAVAGMWERPALSWIYDWAQMRLFEWEANREPAGQTERYDAEAREFLEKQREELIREMRVLPNNRIVVPGMGDGSLPWQPSDPRWLGALRSGGAR